MPSKTYTREDLARALAQKLGYSVDKSKEIVTELLLEMSVQLIEGRTLQFRDFGILKPYVQKPKVGRIPNQKHRGDYIIPARRSVKFVVGKALGIELRQTPVSSDSVDGV